ncbi:MAG: Plastocyanin [Parcubacteria group bacterium GW2011_GWF2_44_8b]|nr:MAG: Plastocyanin [Parcubacteria group bacterium GW2011_GWC1_43_30]KKT80563.1 MAG: Plastocyanin [Parcubacteria group bacterium GW2011_GWF2_44_8b]KKT85518.1 MAG: Plastocyanin [Parcubacteria group bacterium GW2011_GWD1_44_9]
MNNKITAIIIVVVLVGGGLLLFKNRGVAPTDMDINSNMPVPGNEVEETEVMKEFNVDAVPFSFSPSTMSVNKGDTVKITVKNVNGTHDFKIDEFNVSTRTLNTGETQTITFVADKAGTFEYYCSVGNHRAMGMVGTLIVR